MKNTSVYCCCGLLKSQDEEICPTCKATTKEGVAATTIEEFLKKLAKQDNRGTAAPTYLTIRSEEEYQCAKDNADHTKVYWDGDTYDSMETLEQELHEDPDYEESYIKTALSEATEYGVGKRWVNHRMFLTDDEAKKHLASNKHHYSENAHTYTCHAWRAPELAKFMKALFTHFGVEEGNYKINL